jgi:hypothetical protein
MHWAPDIVRADDGSYHMFLTVVPGVFTDWQHPRRIVHLTSTDLRTWRNVVVSGDRAWLFYFTHPGRTETAKGKEGVEQRRSTIQVTELILSGDTLRVERDAPTRIALGGG